jgi:hypothetical protein
MRKISAFTVSFLLILLLANGLASADEERGERTYEITITNLTRDQVFSPPIVIGHNEKFSLFTLGEPASEQLFPLAEDGMTGPLAGHIEGLPSVFDFTAAGVNDAIPPGESLTLELDTKGLFRFISVAGMLVSTNDAFFCRSKG